MQLSWRSLTPAVRLTLLLTSLPKVDATLFRNRSPTVFMRDSRRDAILAALGTGIPDDATWCEAARLHDEPENDWRIKGCPRLRAVDRNVTLLRMRRSGKTHALAIFVNVHPTVLAPKTELNSADLFGITGNQRDQRHKRSQTDLVSYPPTESVAPTH